MIYQTDTKLHPKVREYGCGMLSTIYHVRQSWTVDEVNSLYELCVSKGYMGADCYISWDKFCNHLEVIKFVGFGRVGTILKPEERIITQYYNPRTKFKHFVATDNTGKIVYDPLFDSITVREGHPISTRIFRVE